MAARRLQTMLEINAIFERFGPAISFPRTLRMTHAQQARKAEGGYVSFGDDGLVFKYRVPEAACINGALPLSAMLALIDETTTWASVGLDKYRRPGVSLALEAVRTRAAPVRAGDDLVITSRATKIGRAMGFLSASVADAATGEQLASGRHTKYLVMFTGWNTLLSCSSPAVPALTAYVRSRPPPPEAPGGESAEGSATPALDGPARGLGQLAELSGAVAGTGSGVGAAWACDFTCEKRHLNGMPEGFAGMHGGAQAIVHELGAAAALEAAAPTRGALQLEELSLSYLSSGPLGGCTLAAQPQPVPAGRATGGGGVSAHELLCSSRLLAGGAGPSGLLVSDARTRFVRVG